MEKENQPLSLGSDVPKVATPRINPYLGFPTEIGQGSGLGAGALPSGGEPLRHGGLRVPGEASGKT